jgi:hypothetical protein
MNETLNSSNYKFHSIKDKNVKIFLNNITDKYLIESTMIIFSLFLINIKFGLFLSVIFFIIYLLNHNENKYNSEKKNKVKKELLDEPLKYIEYEGCRPATMNNPNANYLIGSDPTISACIDKHNEDNKNNYIMFNVYENAKNIHIGYTNKASRDFYTKTITKHPVDTNKFAKWLYNSNPRLTCKGDNNCLMFDDIRYHSR